MRRECDQFRCVCAFPLDVVPAPAGVDLHIAAIAPAQLLQDLLERRESRLTIWIVLMVVIPVMLPPGRARLATSPAATGSIPATNTTGV